MDKLGARPPAMTYVRTDLCPTSSLLTLNLSSLPLIRHRMCIVPTSSSVVADYEDAPWMIVHMQVITEV